jgi:hypothetical protein
MLIIREFRNQQNDTHAPAGPGDTQRRATARKLPRDDCPWGTMPIRAMPAALTIPPKNKTAKLTQSSSSSSTIAESTAEHQSLAAADPIDQSSGER